MNSGIKLRIDDNDEMEEDIQNIIRKGTSDYIVYDKVFNKNIKPNDKKIIITLYEIIKFKSIYEWLNIEIKQEEDL